MANPPRMKPLTRLNFVEPSDQESRWSAGGVQLFTAADDVPTAGHLYISERYDQLLHRLKSCTVFEAEAKLF